jgi:hypothetical protein
VATVSLNGGSTTIGRIEGTLASAASSTYASTKRERWSTLWIGDYLAPTPFWARFSYGPSALVFAGAVQHLPVGEVVVDPFFGWEEEYGAADWDGFGAEPISAETIAAARKFYSLLPQEAATPEVAPGADGAIGFEWIFNEGPVRKLFVDVGPSTTWSAYCRLANGATGGFPRRPMVAEDVPVYLKKLFAGLGA